MKAVILAAGMGRRLWRITKNVPKTLIKVGDKPVLHYILDSLLKLNLRDLVVITGHKGYKIRDFITRNYGSKFKVNFIHNEKYNVTNNIYSIYLAKPLLRNNQFIILNSDVLFHNFILEKLLASRKDGVVLSVDLKDDFDSEEMKVRIENEKVVEISKNIDPRVADGEYVGLVRIDRDKNKDFFGAVKEVIKNRGTGVFYEDAFQKMIDDGTYLTFETTCKYPWIEIDTYEDLNLARNKIIKRIESV